MKKYKKEDLESYTLGTTLTLELLNKKVNLVKRVYIHSKQEKNETLDKILNICNKNKIEVIYSDKIINTLSEKENCYVIGVFKKYESKLDYSKNHIVLVNPSNMGNLGTIIRSAVGFGILNIAIIKPAVDLFSPKVIRSSMGAIFNVNIEIIYAKRPNTTIASNALKNSASKFIAISDAKLPIEIPTT